MSILKKIRDRERKLPAAENRVSENAISSTSESGPLADDRQFADLPPARRCLAATCPGPAAIWISIYDRDEPAPTFRCWGCDPPPSAAMVHRRWLLVMDPDEGWTWENFPRYDPRQGPQHDHPNHTTLAGSGDVGDAGAAGSGDAWHDREPTTITAADGSRVTIFEPIGWNDLLRLTVRHGADEAWRMLQERTDLKLPPLPPLRPPICDVEFDLASL